MVRTRLASCLAFVMVAACRSLSNVEPPSEFVDLPWTDSAADQLALQARLAFERGEPRQALDLLDTLLEKQPTHVDARRLRQDILRQRGRRGLLLHESEVALQRAPDDAMACYLRGRIVADGDAKLRHFARAVELAPGSLWPWLGLAHTLRPIDGERALTIYEQLYRATARHPLVAIAFAALLRETRRLEPAAGVYEALRDDVREPGVGDLGLAQVWLQLEQRGRAWQSLLQALRLRPFDAGVQALVGGWLASGAPDDQAAQVLDVLREDPARMVAFASGDGAAVLVPLLVRQGQVQAARRVLAAIAPAAKQPATRRLERRLDLAAGDLPAFLRILREDVPRDLVAAEPNQVRGRWLRLLDGPWQQGDALASAEQAVELLDALMAVGWLAEAELAVEVVLQRWPECNEAAARCDETRRELAFEAGIRRLLYGGYDANDTSDLTVVLQRLRGLSQQVFGRDVVGEPTVFSVPLVGEMVDPFQGHLAAHLARYNRHFVLGRRAGGTAEGLLLTRLSVAELPACKELSLPARCFEVVGIDRDVKSQGGVIGGDLAGVALLNHFLIDHDAVRDWSRSIADRRRIAAEDGMALVNDPLPADVNGDPVDVSWRLSLLSPVKDSDLDVAVLETIRNHERQHLVDSFHYLPIENNVWRGFGLLLEFGFSSSGIEAEMERRAELASLAVSSQTELVLAHIADFLEDPGVESPHHRGFGELARNLTAELQSLGVAAVDADPSRWHRLDMALVRTAAQRMLERK